MSIMWLLPAALLPLSTQAFAYTPIRWGGLSAKKLMLAPRASSNGDYVPLATLAVWHQPDQASPVAFPHFTANHDKTIVWDVAGLCVEASGDRNADAVRVNHCTGDLTQLWNVLSWGHGRENQIQLKGTNKCLDVADRGGGLNGAAVELRECTDTVTETWIFEKQIPLPKEEPSRGQVLSDLIRNAMMPLYMMAALGAISLTAWLRWRPTRTGVAVSQRSIPLNRDLGGVCLAAPVAVHQEITPQWSGLGANVERLAPAVMGLSPSLAEDDNVKTGDKMMEDSVGRRELIAGALAVGVLFGTPNNAVAASLGSKGEVISSAGEAAALNAGKLDSLDPKQKAEAVGLLQPEKLDEFLEELNQTPRQAQRAQAEAGMQAATQKAKLESLQTALIEAKQNVFDLEAELKDGAKASRQEKLQRFLKDATLARDDLEIQLKQQTLLAKDADAALAEARRACIELKQDREAQAGIAKRAARLAALSAQPNWFNYVAAFTASCVSTLVMYPVDVIKTRQMAGTDGDDILSRRDDDDEDASLGESGFLSLYKGLPAALLKNGPPAALYLGVYETVKSALLLNPNFESYPFLVYLIAGGVGEAAGSPIRASLEMVKSRVQSGNESSTDDAIQKVFFDEQGRVNLTQAWLSSLTRDCPDAAVRLAIFEGLKNLIVSSPETFANFDVNTVAAEVILGSIGGAIGALLTVPGDVITTRIMTQPPDASGNTIGLGGMAQKVWEEGGLSELFRGWQARAGYMAPAIGIFLSSYCFIKNTALDNALL